MKFEIYYENDKIKAKTDLTEFFYLLENMKKLDQKSIENILKFVLLTKGREDARLYSKLKVMYSKTIFYAESDEFMDSFVNNRKLDIETLVRIVSDLEPSKNNGVVSFKKFGKISMSFNVMDLAKLDIYCTVSLLDIVSYSIEFDECKLTRHRAGVNLLSLYNNSEHLVDLLIPDENYFKKRRLKFDYSVDDIEVLAKWLYFIYSKGEPNYKTLNFKVKFRQYYEAKIEAERKRGER
ncbi:MAG: hypothetical protein ACRCX8_05525 [Sarcina sp.]